MYNYTLYIIYCISFGHPLTFLLLFFFSLFSQSSPLAPLFLRFLAFFLSPLFPLQMLDNGYPFVTRENALTSAIAPPSWAQSVASVVTGKSAVAEGTYSSFHII